MSGMLVLTCIFTACDSAEVNRRALTFADCPTSLGSQLAQYAPDLASRVDLSCGRLAVPLDYAQPDGEQITLQIIRARHVGQSGRVGSLIFHPGGPGNPGVEYVPYLLSWLPESLLTRFDLVSLDPRGTGGSAGINCPAPAEDAHPANATVLTRTGFAAAARAERLLSQSCLDSLGSRAPHFTTQAAARDVDRLREAVDDQNLTFLGLSYGAKVGAEYARLFPGSVRAEVLDGPSEPSSTVFDDIVRQTKGFEDSFDVYAEGCASRPTCQLGDPRDFVTRLVARADAAPIPSRRRGDTRPADGNDVLEAVRVALYDNVRWPDLDETLDESAHGNSAGLFAMAENGAGPRVEDSAPADSSDANYVINCNDSAVGPTDEQIMAAARMMERNYPLFGEHTAANLFACKTWQHQRSPLPPPVAPTPNRLLVVGTIHDPATPYAGAVALTTILGNATLLTWNGDNHTAMASSRCVSDTAARYLIDLAVPPDGTRCPP